MKKKTVDIGIAIGNDIRTRARINEISHLLKSEELYVLDFSLVSFISRSFADELINLMEDSNGRISITGMNKEVESMIAIVKNGRDTVVTKKQSNGVKVLRTLKEVESFFNCL